MTYQCKKCERQWDDQVASENEFFCTRMCGGRLVTVVPSGRGDSAPSFARSESLTELIPQLPSTLALVIDEYNREQDDYRALHYMCGALEIVARFLTTVVLADVLSRRTSPEEGLSESLLRQLLQHLERPTLGSWRVLLEETVKALPGKKRKKECLLPELPGYARKLSTELDGGKGHPLQKLLPMRNELAHGGRIRDERVKEFCEAHTRRFEDLMAGLRFISVDAEVTLVASPATGAARALVGVTPPDEELDRSGLPEEFRQAGPDRMLLVAPAGVLDLCPLHAYGEVFQVVKDQLKGQGEEALHVYSRVAEPMGVEYTALGSRSSNSRGARSWEERFAEIFRLEAWRARFRVEGALARYSFQERIDGLLKLCIGRNEQARDAAARIAALDGGVLWLAGKPGMGKSAFMAKLVREHFQHDAETSKPRTDLICIPYFFQAQDGDRCRTGAFAEAALLRLAEATGRDIRPQADPQQRLTQFETELREVAAAEATGQKRKIVIFADGVDEVMGVDDRLVDLVFRCRWDCVLWVCAGRDAEPLPQRFVRDRCDWFFERESPFEHLRVDSDEEESLLPPLKADNVRGFFVEELGHNALDQFFGRDKRGYGDDWTNEYVEEVISRSQGLPIYLKLLVADIRRDPNAFAPGSVSLASHWSTIPKSHPGRRYALRYGLNHLVDAARKDASSCAVRSDVTGHRQAAWDLMLEDRFIQAQVRLSGSTLLTAESLQLGLRLFAETTDDSSVNGTPNDGAQACALALRRADWAAKGDDDVRSIIELARTGQFDEALQRLALVLDENELLKALLLLLWIAGDQGDADAAKSILRVDEERIPVGDHTADYRHVLDMSLVARIGVRATGTLPSTHLNNTERARRASASGGRASPQQHHAAPSPDWHRCSRIHPVPRVVQRAYSQSDA